MTSKCTATRLRWGLAEAARSVLEVQLLLTHQRSFEKVPFHRK